MDIFHASKERIKVCYYTPISNGRHNNEGYIPRKFTSLELPFSNTLSFSLGIIEHFKKIGAWYHKRNFGDHFPAYSSLKGSSMMAHMESHVREIDLDLQNNLPMQHSNDDEE